MKRKQEEEDRKKREEEEKAMQVRPICCIFNSPDLELPKK